jgi:hypothetical protein
MKRSRSPLLIATVVTLAVASPAAAVTGYGVAGALHAVTSSALTTSKAKATHTCQAGDGRDSKGTPKKTVAGTVKKPAVVACEQPPRSEVLAQGLKQAGAAALATFG